MGELGEMSESRKRVKERKQFHSFVGCRPWNEIEAYSQGKQRSCAQDGNVLMK